MNWDDQSSLPVLYRQFQWTDRNKIALETIATCLYLRRGTAIFVVRGLPKPFCRTIFDQYPDIFEVFRCPEQLVTVLESIARPTELCLLYWEADGTRVLPGTLSWSGKRQSFGNDFRRPNDFKTHREEPRTIPRDQRGARRTSGLKQVEF